MSNKISLKCLRSGFSQPRELRGEPLPRRGFTLMELMVTLSVLTVLTLLAAPAIRVDGAEADATAHRVRSAMQHAQRLALIQQHQVMVSFDTIKERIRIVEDKNGDRFVTNGERIMWRPLETGNAFERPVRRLNGATTSLPIVGNQIISRNSMPTVVFRRDGSLSSDLEIYVRTRRNGKESRRAITVNMATGRVDWYKYTAGPTIATLWRLGGV